MPRLTRWLIKAAMLYLLLAVCSGVLLALPGGGPLVGLFPVYLHLFVFGWLTQLIFGVALWMFPRYSSTRPRGFIWLGWATFITLNAGMILRAIFEPWNAVAPTALSGTMLVAAAVLQWLAGLGFAVNTWPRIREK